MVPHTLSTERIDIRSRALRLGVLIPLAVAALLAASIGETDATSSSPTQVGADINGEAADDESGQSVAMSASGTRVAIGAPYNDGTGSNAGHVRIYDWNGTTWTQVGADINGEATNDRSGYSVAMSDSGTRVAIGAMANNGTGSNFGTGHVRIYDWNGTTWTQVGADIDGEAASDNSGSSVAMSASGTRIAIGALSNSGSAFYAGHVRIYDWNGTTWTQVGADINGEAANDNSGRVAMSDSGTRVAIGAISNSGTGSSAGHVRVYDWNGTTWTQVGADINGEAASNQSGYSVAMSDSGLRVAIGARLNSGTAPSAGHVRIYDWNGTTWTQFGTDIDGEAGGDMSGWSVAMSASGSHIAIGAVSNAGTASNAGHVRVYTAQTHPSPPTITSVTAGNGSLTVAFTAGTDGGSAITNYKYSTDGTNYTALSPASTTSPFTITGLTNGTTYSVTIKAVNAIGDSAASNATNGTPTAPTTVPAAPTITTVTAVDGSLSVAFTPGSNGGTAITNYKYSTDGTNYTALSPASTTSPFTITGLTNGTTYSVTIKAVNAVGDSAASNAVSGTPVASSSGSSSTSSTTTSTSTTSTTTSVTATTVATATTDTAPTASAIRLFPPKNIALTMSDTLGTGDGIELGAGGFQASEAVLVGFAEDPTGVSTVTASAAGRASATVEVPASKNGKVTAYLYGTSSKRGVKQTLTLTSLPETGTDSSLPTLLGIFLVVSGVLIVARRRLVH